MRWCWSCRHQADADLPALVQAGRGDVPLVRLRWHDAGPMIRPILFKTVVYWAVVFAARLLEGLAEYWIGGGAFAGTWRHLIEHFSWHRFAAIQIWIFVLFLVYTFITELNERLGEGELARMVFRRSSANPPGKPMVSARRKNRTAWEQQDGDECT